jgi:hypothetical protein
MIKSPVLMLHPLSKSDREREILNRGAVIATLKERVN